MTLSLELMGATRIGQGHLLSTPLAGQVAGPTRAKDAAVLAGADRDVTSCGGDAVMPAKLPTNRATWAIRSRSML